MEAPEPMRELYAAIDKVGGSHLRAASLGGLHCCQICCFRQPHLAGSERRLRMHMHAGNLCATGWEQLLPLVCLLGVLSCWACPPTPALQTGEHHSANRRASLPHPPQVLKEYYDSVEETVGMDTQVEHAAAGADAGAASGADAPGTSAAAAAAGTVGAAAGEAPMEAEAEQGAEIVPEAGAGGAAAAEGAEASEAPKTG